jgi:hypothetical protein
LHNVSRTFGMTTPRARTPRATIFYSLPKSPITPADQAEAFFLLFSNRLTKTTGHINTVNGGLTDASLR